MKKGYFILLFFLIFLPFRGNALELISNAKSGILIEAGSGKILYEKNIHEQYSVASMTKMVAQILIMEELEAKKISLDDIVTVSRNASEMGGSQIYLEEGEKISVRDLLKGISVASGNDATVAMAEYISGSEEAFVKRMNQVVSRLKLKHTHFENCTGLDQKNHYSSSYDMAMIARELVMNHPKILEFSSIYEDYLREDTDHKFWLVNTNKLIHFYEGADGLKTGHTDDAGYCLAATAKRKNLRLIGIVLGEEDSKVRNQETTELLDYGFSSVQSKCLFPKNHKVQEIKVDMAKPSKVDIVLKEDLCVVEEKGEENDYQYRVQLNSYSYPFYKGDIIGKIEVLSSKKVVATGALTVSKDIHKLSFLEFYKRTLLNFISGVF